MTGMNQAFVKETDAETQEFRDDARHRKNLEDWLVIQEKKLAVLLGKGKASNLDEEKREKWIRDTREDIEKTRAELERMDKA